MFAYFPIVLALIGQAPEKSWLPAADGKEYWGWTDPVTKRIKYWPHEQPAGGQQRKQAMGLTDPRNQGVDLSRISPVDHFKVEGVADGKKSELDLNDSGKLHLTIIEPDPERRLTQSEIEKTPGFLDIRNKILIHTYGPDAWEVTGVGLATHKGMVEVILEELDGRVVGRFIGPTDPRKIVDAATEGLRRVNPNYNPARDPVPGGKCPLGFRQEHWPAIFVTGVACAFLLYRHRKAASK